MDAAVVEAALQDTTPMAWVIVLILVIILNHLIGTGFKLLHEWVDHRRGNGLQGTMKKLQTSIEAMSDKVADNPPYPQCHYAPNHFDQVEETHRLVKEIHQYDVFDHVSDNHRMLKEVHALQKTHDSAMTSGKFGCRMRGAHLQTIQEVQVELNKGRSHG